MDKGNAGFAMFGSDKCSYIISENASLEYDYIGARVVIEAVNGDTPSDEILKEKGWTFKSNLVSGVKITYNLCGGSVLKPIEDISATEKDKLTITNIVPVRRGYTFKEWNTSIDGFGTRFVSGDTFVVGKYNTTPYDKLKLDLYYIENYSLWMDFKLILMTVKIVFKGESTEGIEEGQTTADDRTGSGEEKP